MSDIISTLPNWAAAGGTAGAGYFMIRWLFEWLGGRLDKREAVVAARDERLDTATYKLIENLEARMNALSERLERVEGELVECRAQHAECEAQLGRLLAIQQGYGEVKQRTQSIIAAERLADRTEDKP